MKLTASRIAGISGTCLGILLLASHALAQPIHSDVLATGERGQTYHDVFGANLVRQLPAFRIKHRATSGSAENLELLAKGVADLGFAQADVYAERVRIDPDRFGKLVPVGRLVDECLFLVRRRDGPIRSLADLGNPVDGRAARIAVGPEGSGMSATWGFLSTLVPGLGAAEVVHTGGVLSVNHLGLGMLDAVGWVSAPGNREHVLLKATLAKPELELVQITDPGLEHSLDDGTPIYRLRTFEEKGRWGKKKPSHQTLCTAALVLASADANPRLIEQTSQALTLKRGAVLGLE